MIDILDELGRMDIYLIDQLMKGRYQNCKRILDVGCGSGRNSHFFLKNGYEVDGADQNYQCPKPKGNDYLVPKKIHLR